MDNSDLYHLNVNWSKSNKALFFEKALNSCAGLEALKNGNALSASATKTGHWGAQIGRAHV